MRLIAFAVIASLANTTLAFAAPVPPVKTRTIYNSAYCFGQSQVCNAPNFVKLTVTKRQSVTLKFIASEIGCSSVRVNPSINGRALGWSAYLGYAGNSKSLNTRAYKLGVLPKGTFLISTIAQGIYGGCNIGYLGSWGGTFSFTGRATSDDITRHSVTVPDYSGMANISL